MKRGRKPLALTPDQISKVTDQGWSVRRLAGEMTVHYETVRLALLRAGVKKGRGQKESSRTREIRELVALGQSHSTIAKALGVSRSWVSKVMRRRRCTKGKATE